MTGFDCHFHRVWNFFICSPTRRIISRFMLCLTFGKTGVDAFQLVAEVCDLIQLISQPSAKVCHRALIGLMLSRRSSIVLHCISQGVFEFLRSMRLEPIACIDSHTTNAESGLLGNSHLGM